MSRLVQDLPSTKISTVETSYEYRNQAFNVVSRMKEFWQKDSFQYVPGDAAAAGCIAWDQRSQ